MTKIKVTLLEFVEGGNTIWVHSPKGATVLRIKCTGKIHVSRECQNTAAHSDMMVNGDIEMCVPARKKKKTCQTTTD
jgi:hypothetical protein